MKYIITRKCNKNDKNNIINICFHTGYMGEDARSHFHDKKLFGLLFCSYYPKFESHNSFIAVTKENGKEKVIGYVLCSLDTKEQEIKYKKRFQWKILVRLVLITSWKYFHDFKLVLSFISRMLRYKGRNGGEIAMHDQYPAHLHVDVMEEYQNKGIGTQLIKRLEEHLKKKKIAGICLGTSERNYKSIPFYKKHGYRLLKVSSGLAFWPGTDNVKSLYFGKKFN